MTKITLEAKNAAEGIKQQESHNKEIRICVTGLLDQRILADITKAIEETYTSQDSVLLDLSGTTGLTDFTISGVDCASVKELILPASIERINNRFSFRRFPNLKSLSVVPENESFKAVDGVLYTKNMSTLIACFSKENSFTVPEGVTRICKYAFTSNSINELSLPEY